MALTMTITDDGLDLVRDGFSGANNPKLMYIAVGSGMTTPADGDTTMGNELFRKAVTSFTNNGTGGLIATLYLSQSDAVGMDIEEVAVFGGSTASTALGSGVMVARALFGHGNKSDTESINLQCSIPIGRG